MQAASRKALASAGIVVVLLLLVLGVVAVIYIETAQSNTDQISSQNQQINALQSELQILATKLGLGPGAAGANISLPVMNQAPTIRSIRETWYLSPAAHQDRFEPSFMIVNQGDTVALTLIDNDTVAHDFVLGPPYSIIVNATVPGLVNDLTGQVFTTPARNNSPGVWFQGPPATCRHPTPSWPSTQGYSSSSAPTTPKSG